MPETNLNQYTELIKILDEYDKSQIKQPMSYAPPSVQIQNYTNLENIDSMKLPQLIDTAKQYGFKDDNNMSRAILIDYLQNIIQFVE